MYILQQLCCLNWYKSPPVQLPPHSGSRGLERHTLVLESCTTINRNSVPVACVSNSTQTVKPPGVSQQPTVFQPSYLVSRTEHLQEQGFSSEVVEKIATPQRPTSRAIYQSKWTFLKNGAEKV